MSRHSNLTRAMVVIRQRDPEDAGAYEREWVHKSELELDDLGVWLHYTADRCDVFLPWSSVVRIDYEPCYCFSCSRIAA